MHVDGVGDSRVGGVELGVLLRGWRQRALLSQDQLAERSGLSARTIRRLERGIKVARPHGASLRQPITARHEVDLQLTARPAGFACSTLICEIQAPEPVGRMVFVNHLPDWQLTHEAEREQQTVTVARFIDNMVDGEPVHVIVAGDMDATPDAASIRFWTGKQSLDGLSVCYRDAWAACHPGDPGLTFTPENRLMPIAEVGDWELEPGRRIDYLLTRCTDHGPTLHTASCRFLFDRAVDGVWASDHFGVTADLSTTTPSGRRVP
jgi:endonuclease/exonuclease/phosphatase family metal-dependent hydrolase